jgi:hypothetical protein
MKAEEFLFSATLLIDFGGNHQGHSASNTDKTCEQERSIGDGSERTETGE